MHLDGDWLSNRRCHPKKYLSMYLLMFTFRNNTYSCSVLLDRLEIHRCSPLIPSATRSTYPRAIRGTPCGFIRHPPLFARFISLPRRCQHLALVKSSRLAVCYRGCWRGISRQMKRNDATQVGVSSNGFSKSCSTAFSGDAEGVACSVSSGRTWAGRGSSN
jgi:hypothetical protein